MAHPLNHAERSAKRFGGKTEDCLPIHNWFDESKAFFPDFCHRALRHHAEGIFLAQKLFGVTIVNSDGTQIPVRYVGEQHDREDLGPIPHSSGLALADPATALDVWSAVGRRSAPYIKRMPREQPPTAMHRRSAGGIQTE